MKALKRILVVILVLGVILGGVGYYAIHTPEYALKKIGDDVKLSGIDGLYPHLTGKARETVDSVSSVMDNDILGAIIGLIGQSDYVSVLKSKIQEIQWGVKEVLKNSKNASVILTFNYEEKLTGTVTLSMVKEEGSWKIDGIELPKFENVNL